MGMLGAVRRARKSVAGGESEMGCFHVFWRN
jgi:hypothetical protein